MLLEIHNFQHFFFRVGEANTRIYASISKGRLTLSVVRANLSYCVAF